MDLWGSTFGKIFMTLLVSMTPVIELRMAIPMAVAHGVNYWTAVTVSIIGNLLPVPFIVLFIRKIFEAMRKWSRKLDGVITKLEKRAEKKSDVVQRYAFWGLFILVAIPLPGTGAWTGALVAAMLNMRLRRAFPAIAFGVLVAAAIITLATYGADVLLF